MMWYAVNADTPRVQVDWNSPEAIEIEKAITFTYGRKFKDRGPDPPHAGGPALWRNQVWRATGNRWGNRGGANREAWAAKFRAAAASLSGKGEGKSKAGKSSAKGDAGVDVATAAMAPRTPPMEAGAHDRTGVDVVC